MNTTHTCSRLVSPTWEPCGLPADADVHHTSGAEGGHAYLPHKPAQDCEAALQGRPHPAHDWRWWDGAWVRCYGVPEPRCIEAGASCSGPVEYRMPLSATGKPFPRCEHHWQQRLDTEEQLRQRYPDTPTPPADFDPTYAGEAWDEDY